MDKAAVFWKNDRAFRSARESFFFRANFGDFGEIFFRIFFIEEQALNDQIGVAADGAGEMTVVFERQTIMADIVR